MGKIDSAVQNLDHDDNTLVTDEFCIIVGAMKCGTTSLFHYLSQHPEIAPCSIKEPNYFTQNFERGFSWYRGLWNWNTCRHRIALEASTNYSKIPMFPNAAEHIARAPGRYRFVYSVRNPLDVIESGYNHGRVVGWEGTEIPLDLEVTWSLLCGVRYSMQIGEYRQRFGKEAILVIDHQELDQYPLRTLDRICRFAGVTTNYPFDVSHRCNLASDWLAQPVKITGRPERKARLRDQQRAMILRELHHDLEVLQYEYGINVDQWGLN